MLMVEGVHTFYGERHVLQGVSLQVAAGQLVAVLGRNGAGKTTLVRSIMGLTPPRAGTIRLEGVAIHGRRPYEVARLGIGLVPQGRRIFPSLTVLQNLQVAARRGAWDVTRIFELLPRLHERRTHRAGQLSGGEQQMLAIGRALMANPRWLLLDEPSEGLAPLLVQELGRVLGHLKGTGAGILLVEQNLGLATAVADRVYVLNRGEIAFDGSPGELTARREVRVRHLGV